MSIDGKVYDRHDDREVTWFVHDLVQTWRHPDTHRPAGLQVDGMTPAPAVWRDAQSKVEPGGEVHRPGLGRRRPHRPGRRRPSSARPSSGTTRPPPEQRRHLLAQHRAAGHPARAGRPRRQPVRQGRQAGVRHRRWPDRASRCRCRSTRSSCSRSGWRTAGRSSSGTRRETLGAREFKCWKFRSMRKDAEKMKALLKKLEPGRRPAVLHRERPPADPRRPVPPQVQPRRAAAVLERAGRRHVASSARAPARGPKTSTAPPGARPG